jgi:hypothetical protein
LFKSYLIDRTPNLATKLALQSTELGVETLSPKRHTVFLVGADPHCLPVTEECLSKHEQGIVMVTGLGKAGECPTLTALLSAFGPTSQWRIALVREMGEGLASSQLGLLYNRTNSAVEEMVFRLRGFYAGNFRFLEILKNACQMSLQMQEMKEELAVLRQGVALSYDGAAGAHALPDPCCQLTLAVARRAHRLLPMKALRNRLATRLMRAFQIWRLNGTRALVGKVYETLCM